MSQSVCSEEKQDVVTDNVPLILVHKVNTQGSWSAVRSAAGPSGKEFKNQIELSLVDDDVESFPDNFRLFIVQRCCAHCSRCV
jgi:hypothetical protein